MAAVNAQLADPAPAESAGTQALEQLVAVQARLLAQEGFVAAASAFVTELAERYRFDRVSLGLRRRGRVELVAVSHARPGADVGHDRELAAAMEESLASGATICVPATDSAVRIAAANTGLVRRFGGAACSIALMHAGEPVGAVCCERRGRKPLEAAEIGELEHLLCLLGPVVYLRWRDAEPLAARVAAAARAWCAGSGRPRWKRAGLGLVLLLLVLAAALPAHWTIGGRARVEGSVQRILFAPAEGYLQAVHVRPGDRVAAGQLLLELADRDLKLEQRKLAGQLEQHENAYAHAIARGERAQAVVHMARAAEAKALAALVKSRLERVQVVAPFDGIVLGNDLGQSVGAPVQLGGQLLTVAATKGYRVVVQVDERDVAAVTAGREGSLSLSALPWDSLPIRVTRVSPLAQVVDGANVFEVEAELLATREGVRPGLNGVARIAAGERPLLAGWSRRVLDWARLTLWSWTGWP